MTHNSFKEIVCQGIKNTNLSVEALAAKFQVSKRTVQRWINGTSKPHPRIQEEVAFFFSHIHIMDV